jgi:GTP-binding protein EngB required for normal cell division
MAEERFPSSEHEQTFDSLHHFLSSENRKMHFFFIDCANANRPNADGLRQGDYLNAAANYFNNNDIFKNSTDAIYVVLTKSDLLTDEEGNKIEPEQRLEFAKKYLQSQNYTGFINVLKSICKKHGINGGKLTVEPFSLGKVYFRDICDFDGTTAKRIVDILMDRIQTSRKSFFNVLNQ